MKIAVWRLGAALKFETDSMVGGGFIAKRLLMDLIQLGHTPVVLGGAPHGSETSQWLALNGIEEADDLPKDTDACLVLTGPFNAMFGSLYDTYTRLARFEGKCFYAWWDTALPFHFKPETVGMFREKCSVTSADLARNKEWTLLTQMDELPGKAAKSVGRGEFRHAVRRCFWELMETQAVMPPISLDPTPRLAYFGSDRPGRVGEMKRWFGTADSPPLDLWGKWSEKSLKALGPNVCHRGPIAEGQVRGLLNRYMGTLHTADMAYVKSDFIAQRFMENAMAGVPVAYSNRIQPTIAQVVPEQWVMRSPDDLALWWYRVSTNPAARRLFAEENRQCVLNFADLHPHRPIHVLREVLS